MQDLEKKLSQLSPEKRELLLKKLKEKGLNTQKEYEKIKPRKDQSVYPMSFAQERLWFLDQLNPNSSFYNIPAAIKIIGKLDVNNLIEAFKKVLDRHENLNVIFKSENKGPIQYLRQNEKFTIKVIDFSQFDEKTRSERLKNQIDNLSNEPFNLSEGPLYRALLVKLNDNENVFIVCFHHIIADGWSISVLINDLLKFYQSCLNGTHNNLLEPLDIQYFDFSFWQKQKLEKGEFNLQLEYWKNELKNIPELLNLPVDNPRSSIQTFNGGNFEFRIPNQLKQKLLDLSKISNASMFMILLAAFQVLLRRFSGQNDFGIGIPAANRNHPQIKNLIGFFVNSLVIRSNIDLDLTFLDFLEIIKEKVLKASENQDIPFEKIVEALGIKKDISHTPLFQVMFDFQVNPLTQIQMPGIKLEIIKPEVNSAKFDLLLLIEELKDEFICSFEYNSDLFNLESISGLCQSFLTLLEGIVSTPYLKLKYHKIITKNDFEKIVNGINQTSQNIPLNIGVHNYFEEQVKKNPDKIALEFGDESLTYFELNKKANQLAWYLKSKGIEMESTVGVALDRSFEQIISVIAIVKCGAVYVPLDISYPPERISYMLRDSGVSLLIKTKNTQVDLSNEKISTLDIDSIENQLKQNPSNNLRTNITSDNVVYIMYTSGSTGVPKGVSVLHSGVMRLVKQDDFGNMNNQNFLALSSFSFDAATLEIWGSLANGSKLILHHPGKTSLNKIAKIIREKKISFIWLTAGLFNTMVEEYLEDLIRIKQILTGGEVLSVPHVNKVLAKLKGDQILVNGYGPTENTTFTACYKMLMNNEFKFSVPIGYPIKNTQIYILDENFNIQPTGVIGELCVGGLGLARGYHNSPVITAEKFIPNEYSGKPGDRLYRTGDLAKLNNNGVIEFVGRIDNQVKLRGFRIELGEIESVLREHEAVNNCIVIFTKNDTVDAHLTAYLKFNSANKIGIDFLKQYLKEKLPEHMIPGKFIEVDKFYLTPNGKIDKSRLPSEQNFVERRQFIAPRNDVEKYLVNLWKEVLEVKDVSVYDDFFELGGNSLKAAILINRIQKDFNVETHVGVIFKAPRIAEFATYMLEYYPDVVKDNFNLDSELYSNNKTLFDGESDKIKKINNDKIKSFRNIIKINHPNFIQSYKKNPKALFILSPPRSGSTLLRVMLAGNKNLFSPPELDLLSFNSLKQRDDFFRKKGLEIWLESIIRAVMELKGYDATKAERYINELEEKNISTIEFFGLMQDWLGNNRLLVDKTPSYAMDYELLERAEESFDEPLYIHLIRHPYAMIYSFIEAKLDEQFFKYDHSFNRRELAELIWLVSNQNIINFSKNISDNRIIQIKFEDLVIDPEKQLQSICSFMGVKFSNEMLDVYKGNKMTDAVKKNSQMVGDFKFYLRNKIDPNVVNRWENFHKEDFLCEQSINISKQLNYDLSDVNIITRDNLSFQRNTIKRLSRNKDLPLSYAQQRMWFLDQLEPGKATYNIPGVVELKGELDIEILERSINEIVKRHESLRTSFLTEDGKAKQIISPYSHIRIDIIDLSDNQLQDIRSQSDSIIKEESQKPFILSSAPLFRIKLLVLGVNNSILMLTMHHIIYDGWSSEIFVKELSIFYSSFVKKEKSNLDKLEFQYADFAAWQREWLQGKSYEQHLDYWKKKLANSPTLLELPTDFSRPPIQKHKGKRIQFEMDQDLVNELTILANKESVTLYILFLAAYNILLHKYSKSEDILIGTPVAGRNRKEIEPIIGLFVNTLVLRNTFSKDYSIKHFLQNVKRVFVEAMNHQEIPFEKLVDELKIERSLSHTPLFQVMFVFNNSPVSNIQLPGLTIQPKALDLGTSKFDLNLVITKRNERIRGVLEYDTDLFSKTTVLRMIEHFKNTLSIIKTNLAQPISEIQLISDSEKNELLKNYIGKKLEYSGPKVLHKIFESNFRPNSDRIAVVYNDKHINFSELNRKSNKLANYFIRKGITQESLIAVCLERSVESIISIFAIWKAGAVYLPLDPSYPKDRLDYMLSNSGARLVITTKQTTQDLALENSPTIILDEEWQEIENELDSNLNVPIFPQNLAYMIYTSGSTGLPKGVMVQHQSAVNLANGLNEIIYAKYKNKKIRVSLNAPFPFDASMQEIVMLIFGHTLVIIPEELKLVPESFLSYIREKEVDLLDCVPTQLNYLIENGLLDENYSYPKIVLSGGEPIDGKIWSEINSVNHIDFFNMYGPTECTVDSTICEVKHELKKPNIGKPIYNTSHYVLDENMQLTPFGIPGELYIGGDCLSRGYLAKAELTAERFLPNPFSEREGERIYRTGDLVRFMADGNIEYLRRLDDQVKLRGFRIELGEIESLLNKHGSVKQSIVVLREDEPNIKRLVAYLRVEETNKNIISDLRNYLTPQLPDYMIPSVFILLDEIPLLPNGKVNRSGLPIPKIEDNIIGDDYSAPVSVKEKALAKIWEQILKIENIGIKDNFFELGGDSILGIQVIAKANKAGIKISPKDLFQFPTIKGLAAVAKTARKIVAEQDILEGKVELTPIQHWFFEQKLQKPNHWNQSILLEVNDKLDEQLFRKTIAKLVEHHDALRMKYDFSDKEVTQSYLYELGDIPFEFIDLSIGENENLSEIITQKSNEAQASLNLSNGKVFKCIYFYLGENIPGRLLIIAHHLIIDGISWRILTEDIQTIYGQLKKGLEATLPAKTTSFKYWSERLKSLADSESLIEEEKYWKNLSLIQNMKENNGSNNLENTEKTVSSVSKLLDKKLTKTLLTEVPEKYNTEINDVLLTALVLSNSIWKGSRKMTVSLEGHGREDLFEDVDISRTIGWFTSLYPVVLDLETVFKRTEALKLIKEQLREIPNNGIGYGIIKYLKYDSTQGSDLPHLSEISFNYLGQFNKSDVEEKIFKIAKENKGFERAKENNRPFQIDISGSIVDSELKLNWIFNKNKYSQEEILKFADAYLNELTQIIEETLSESGGYTPSDFKEANLDNQELDSIFSELDDEFGDE